MCTGRWQPWLWNSQVMRDGHAHVHLAASCPRAGRCCGDHCITHTTFMTHQEHITRVQCLPHECSWHQPYCNTYRTRSLIPQLLPLPPAVLDSPHSSTKDTKGNIKKYIWNVYYDLGKQFWQWGENFSTVNFELNYHQNIWHLNTSFFLFGSLIQALFTLDSDLTFIITNVPKEVGSIPSMRETT